MDEIEAIFGELVGELRKSDDVGLVELKRALIEASQLDFKDDASRLVATLAELNERWEYADMSVRFSGKLYVHAHDAYGDFEAMVRNVHSDADFGDFGHVDDCELISKGIGALPRHDAEGHIAGWAFGYLFADKNTPDIPLVFAFPEELDPENLPVPTHAEVVRRLETHYAEFYIELQSIAEDIYSSDLQKLQAIEKAVLAITPPDTTLIELTELYIQRMVAFDGNRPHTARVKRMISFADKDDYERSEDGGLLPLMIDGSMTLPVYDARVIFYPMGGVTHLVMVFEAPNGEDAEVVAVSVNDIEQLTPLRLTSSLAEIAFQKGGTDEQQHVSADSSDELGAALRLEDEVPALRYSNEWLGDDLYKDAPEHIKDLVLCMDVLGELMSHARLVATRRFLSRDDATEAVEKFADTITRTLNGVDKSTFFGTWVMVSGEGVEVPHNQTTIARDETSLKITQSYLAGETSLRQFLEPGDEIKAIFMKQGVVIEGVNDGVEDEDEDEDSDTEDVARQPSAFAIKLLMLAMLESSYPEGVQIAAADGVPSLHFFTEHRYAEIDLSKQVSIEFSELTAYRAVETAIRGIGSGYADEPAVQLLDELKTALFSYPPEAPLQEFHTLHSFGAIQDFLSNPLRTDEERRAIRAATEAVLMNRYVQCSLEGKAGTKKSGTVVDISYVDGVTLTLRENQALDRVNLSSVGDLSF